jgi:hypothetical protein
MYYSLIFNHLDLGNLKDFLNLILALSYVGIKLYSVNLFAEYSLN